MGKDRVIGELLFLRNIAHLRHLCTTSYAEHIALEEFYTELLELTDLLAEVIQHRHTFDFSVPNASTSMVSEDGRINIYFESFKSIASSTVFTQAEQNVVDDILTLIDRTKYKLNNLV